MLPSPREIRSLKSLQCTRTPYAPLAKFVPNSIVSEVILRFAEPFKDDDGLVSRAMIEMAIIIWNASFMPKDMQRKAVEDVVNVLPSDDREARREMFLIVNMLLERKRQYFSSNKRMIMDYHITESAHSIHLDVVSTVPEGYHPER